MSSLFPQLDPNAVSRSLRPGRRVAAREVDTVAAMRAVERLGLITTRSRRYIRCANARDADYLERPLRECQGVIELGGPQSAVSEQQYCPECGHPIETIAGKEQFEDLRVEGLVPAGIVRYLTRALRELPITRSIARVEHASLCVTLTDGRELSVVLLDSAGPRYHSAGLFFAEPVMYVVACPIHWPLPHVLEGPSYIQLAELLCRPTDWLSERLDRAAYPLRNRPSLHALEAAFDAMLASHAGWQHFEQEFVPRFFVHMSGSGERLERYLGQLSRLRGTILDFFTVPIGGAGNTDTRQLSRFELVNELCEGDLIADAKKLVRSTLNKDAITRILWHLETDPGRPRRAVVVLARDGSVLDCVGRGRFNNKEGPCYYLGV